MSNTPPISSDMQDAATTAALPRRTLMLLSIMVPAIVLTVSLVLSERRAVRVADAAAKAIPATFVSPQRVWTSTNNEFSEEEMQVLETRDYVYRSYSDGAPNSQPVELCAIFSEDNRKGTHPPDVCLEASGFRILNRHDREVDVGNGVKLTVRELVTVAKNSRAGAGYLYFAYFYKCGDTFTTSFYHQQVQIIFNGLARRNASGALIRYSTPMGNFNDIDSARVRTDQLITLTYPYIRDSLR